MARNLSRRRHRPVRRHAAHREEGIDLAILPIGDNYTMGPEDSIRAIKLIEPKKVIPIHYDTFPVIAQDAKAWAAKVKAETSAEPIVQQRAGHCSLTFTFSARVAPCER